MKKTLVCLLTLISFSVYSQNYTIESNFDTGKTYHFTVKRARIDLSNPITQDLAQLTEIEATFTQQDNKLKCVWKYGETKSIGPEEIISQTQPEYIELANIYRGFEIAVLFDPFLGGIELLNHTQMKQNVINGFLNVYKNPKTKIDSAEMSLIIQQIEPTISTPELLLSTYFPEILLYFNLYAQSFTDGIGVKSEYVYPNPFGGDPIPVVGEISIDSKKENVLIIKNEEKANQEEVNRIFKETFEKISQNGSSPITKEEMPNFTLNSKSEYYYDLKHKLISRVMNEKTIAISGTAQTQTLEINLIE